MCLARCAYVAVRLNNNELEIKHIINLIYCTCSLNEQVKEAWLLALRRPPVSVCNSICIHEVGSDKRVVFNIFTL